VPKAGANCSVTTSSSARPDTFVATRSGRRLRGGNGETDLLGDDEQFGQPRQPVNEAASANKGVPLDTRKESPEDFAVISPTQPAIRNLGAKSPSQLWRPHDGANLFGEDE